MELNQRIGDFESRGVECVAVSSNSRDLAAQSVEEWGLDKLTVGHGLPVEEARKWGLFVSSAIQESEPERFVEPGLFVIAADRTLQASAVQSMPFSRPSADQLLQMLDFFIDKGYPPRGVVPPSEG